MSGSRARAAILESARRGPRRLTAAERRVPAGRGAAPADLRRLPDAAAAGALGPPGCVANCVRPVLPQPSAGSDSVGETAVPQDRARRGLLRAAQQSGYKKKLWKKSTAQKKRLREFVLCNRTQCKLLDKMTTSFWKRRNWYVDDPYQKYHDRTNLSV
ncbi:39S ribosomal protein L35, mitochondrial isoform X2 [Gallus gallus]|uniref:39S ribosomal protein L35, mitochondrial isoform X2 n=1 Tax=Gallus gallus TaxID=9031 RepID=UPI001F02168D|nr:39S ribosomal protein L35, mitochondrial isoform X2 [Gallus gallus]